MFTNVTGEDIFAAKQFHLDSDLLSSRVFILPDQIVNKSELVYWNGLYISPESYTQLSDRIIIHDDVPLSYLDSIYIRYLIGD